jgi:site-specific DNA-methyltransferase (adenine-specific)
MTPYYADDLVTIYHGRCEDVLPSLSGISLVVTSPPYNLGTTGGGTPMGHYSPEARFGNARGGVGKWARATLAGGLAHGYGVHDDAMPHDEYVTWQHDVLRAMWATLTDDGAIFYNHKPRVLGGLLVSPLAYVPRELPVRQVVVWARAGGTNFSPAFYLPTHEWIVVIAKPEWRLKSKGASGVGDVWYIPQESGTAHPAPFPVGLPARAIETTPHGLVLDPFMGSGSTLVAAKAAGRPAIGIEREERWCDYAATRLSQGVLGLSA